MELLWNKSCYSLRVQQTECADDALVQMRELQQSSTKMCCWAATELGSDIRDCMQDNWFPTYQKSIQWTDRTMTFTLVNPVRAVCEKRGGVIVFYCNFYCLVPNWTFAETFASPRIRCFYTHAHVLTIHCYNNYLTPRNFTAFCHKWPFGQLDAVFKHSTVGFLIISFSFTLYIPTDSQRQFIHILSATLLRVSCGYNSPLLWNFALKS